MVAVSSSASLSSAAATVTVWVVDQSDVVKVSVVWLPWVLASVSTITSLLLLPRRTVTVAVGWVARRAVKVVLEPSSTDSVAEDTVTAGVSLSVTVTLTVSSVTLP